jgi:phosphoribosylaminoimidazolecarboxamide formyltransferase/IMP cyclohydrolase
MESPKIRTALISVSDKTGIADFARELAGLGVRIISTGGTRAHLESQGVPVTDISQYTGFPEVMAGRVKTLHPKVFGGILCRRNLTEDMQVVEEHGIWPIELVVVNLYPFEATVTRPTCSWEEAIENIDIGGPSLIRAAAKNHAFVTIATRPEQYAEILSQIRSAGCTTPELRRKLAAAAFAHTAYYDAVISSYFASKVDGEELPAELALGYRRKASLRYGENPHQKAAVYQEPLAPASAAIRAVQLHGKELSFNNLLDLESALEVARSFAEPAAAVIKHNNPCGAAVAKELAEALRKALAGDPVSAFGSVLGLNRPVDQATAEVLTDPSLFIEAIIAPEFTPEALSILTTRPKWRANVRLMQVGPLDGARARWAYRFLEGGVLVQEADILPDPEDQWQVVTEKQPTTELWAELRFAWTIVRHVKSNAIVVTKDRMLLGAGAGQMSRVDSVEIAIRKAGDRVRGAVLASDAFFPFPDSIELAAKAGVAAIIQPGGSVRDKEVIAACNQYSLPMIFTGRRHFKH